MFGWKFVELKNYEDVKANFRKQICKFNADKLIAAKGATELSDAEFRRLLLQVESFDVITAAEHWKNNNACLLYTSSQCVGIRKTRLIQNQLLKIEACKFKSCHCDFYKFVHMAE